MTQPAALSPVQIHQQVTQVAEAITMVVAPVDPRITTMALITVVVTAAQAAGLKRDELLGALAQTYDKTVMAMQALGIKPGEAPSADAQARVKKMMEDALKAQGTDLG